MTQNKKFKQTIRERMAKTGETYMQARRALDDGRHTPTKLRLIGYWKHFWDQQWPDPLYFVDASWDATERQKVIDYLRAGTFLRTTNGTVHDGNGWCRLGCHPDPAVLGVRKDFFAGSGTQDTALSWQQRRIARYQASQKHAEANLSSRQGDLDLGRGELTDGTYVWPEGLVHYLEEHNVRLPDEFVQHVLKKQTPDKQVPEKYEIDTSWWLESRYVLTSKELTERTRWAAGPPVMVQVESPFLPGWYYNDVGYPEEGSSGPYMTREDAETAAKLADYELEDVEFWEQKDLTRVFNRHMFTQIEKQVRDVAAVFENSKNSAKIREALVGRLEGLLSEMVDKMKKQGVRTPPLEGIELFWPETTKEDREKRLLRCEVRIKDPRRYSQFVDALMDEGLLPVYSLVGRGFVEDRE